MKALMLIATALMISTPVFAAPVSKEAVIIKLPRIEVVGKRHDAINKASVKLAALDTPIANDAVIIKLPRIEVVGKRRDAIHKTSVKMAASDAKWAKDAVIIKLPRIEVLAKRESALVLPSMMVAAEQGDGVFFNTAMPSMAIVKKINLFMPYGV
ncbi:hypothetical protein [Iodobacter fluviatilis]|uniref:Uncharacterized protein n=1 Tax=Iodobacter fluviatilis TaxID=537 RepID=A0A377Q9V6_9NEIS|nr:hypothetical protein [Iodobacter fluviatilis]TCU82392.1 hypothetical protein EV682_11531 [Iodobacter fluviatilis]STQ91617.1 Uncharacterised protein [Iodobacter fluviatilis]